MPSNHDLYERELDRFRAVLNHDHETALDRFGMTLVHSLPPHERVSALRRFGVEPRTANDYYNLGFAAAQQDDWTEAIAMFRKATGMEEPPKEAFYNLAVAYERNGMAPQAKQAWQAYLDYVTGEEKTEVKAHLATL